MMAKIQQLSNDKKLLIINLLKWIVTKKNFNTIKGINNTYILA